MPLIAEDLLLLLLDDEKGAISWSTYTDAALGGAVLTELAVIGAVHVHDPESRWARAKVRVASGATVDDPVLADALADVAARERTAQDLVNRFGKGLKPQLLTRLEDRGMLRRDEQKVLGLFPRTRWPATDVSHEEAVRRQLTGALVTGLLPDQRTAALVAVLSALGLAHKVVRDDTVPPRDVRERAKEIAESDWAAEAVRDAVQAAQAATVAATTAAVAVTAASGG